jgi:hypothetical protein
MAKLGGEQSVWGSDGVRYDPGMDVPAKVASEWSNPDIAWEDGDAPASDDDGDDGGDDGPSRPAGNASRDAWVEYARTRGASDGELAAEADGGLTRNELRDKYGS